MTTEEILSVMLAESEKQTRILEDIRKALDTMGRQSATSSEEMKRRMEDVKGMFVGTPLETILSGMGGKS